MANDKYRMKLLICISGSGGGNSGPNGLYNFLQTYLTKHDFRVLQFDTLPNGVEPNVNKLIKLILTHFNVYKDIYLMGWSMGGAVAINVAYYINHVNGDLSPAKIKGVVLLATQEAEMNNINFLDIPILFIHGKEDHALPCDISLTLYNKYKYDKDLFIINNVGHYFEIDIITFSTLVIKKMFSLFMDTFPDMYVKSS